MFHLTKTKKIAVTLSILAVLTMIFSTPGFGQNRPGRMGKNQITDNRVIEINGLVTNVQKEKTCRRFEGSSILATIQSGEKSYQVQLGSEYYLKNQGVTLSKNSKIRVKIRPSYRNRPGQYIAVSMNVGGKELTVPRGFANRSGHGRRGKRNFGRNRNY